MHSKKRRAILIDELINGEVNVEELASRFGVSPSTIRRDLQHLAQNGHIQRTYGGAVLNYSNLETTFLERMEKNGAKKLAVARAAADLIKNGDTIILDAGTTIFTLGRLLIGRKLQIITNNLMLVSILSDQPGIELILLGGLCHSSSLGTFGSMTLDALENVGADYLFTSAEGIVADKGLCDISIDQIILKKNMMLRSGRTIVLADSSKINRSERHAWLPLPTYWTLITDKISKADQTTFENMGAKIICAS